MFFDVQWNSKITTVDKEAVRDAMENICVGTTTVAKRFKKQSPALSSATDGGVLMFSKDIPHAGKGKKCFYSASVDALWNDLYGTTVRQSRYFYEMLIYPCCFYMDVECYPKSNPDMAPFNDIRRLLLQSVLAQFVKQYDGVPYRTEDPDRKFRVTDVEIFESDSSKCGEKISRHYTFRVKGAMFAGNDHCGAFQRCILYDSIEQSRSVRGNPLFLWPEKLDANRSDLDEDQDKVPVCDHAVYTRKRSIRLLWSTKGGQWRPLVEYRRWTARHVGDNVWENVCGDDDASSDDYSRTTTKDNFTERRDILETSMLQYLRRDEVDDLPIDGLFIMRCNEPNGSAAIFTSALITHPGYQKRAAGQQVTRQWDQETFSAAYGCGMSSGGGGIAETRFAQRMFDRAHSIGGFVVQSESSGSTIDRIVSSLIGNFSTTTSGGAGDSDGTEYEFPRLSTSEVEMLLHSCMNGGDSGTGGDNGGGGSIATVANQLCILLGNAIHMYTGIPEQLRYYRMVGGYRHFVYQFDSHYCPIVKREHEGNHIRIGVRIDPYNIYSQNDDDIGETAVTVNEDDEDDGPVFTEEHREYLVETFGEERAMDMILGRKKQTGGAFCDDNGDDVLVSFNYICYTCPEKRTRPVAVPFDKLSGGDILRQKILDFLDMLQSRRRVTFGALMRPLLGMYI